MVYKRRRGKCLLTYLDMESWLFANFLYVLLVTVFFKNPLFLFKNKIFTLFCILIRLVLHYFVDLLYSN